MGYDEIQSVGAATQIEHDQHRVASGHGSYGLHSGWQRHGAQRNGTSLEKVSSRQDFMEKAARRSI